MNAQPQPIGEILDRLGVIGILEENEYASESMVVMRIVNFEDGGERISISFSDGTGYMMQRGMIETARDFIEMSSPALNDCDDDEDEPGGTVTA